MGPVLPTKDLPQRMPFEKNGVIEVPLVSEKQIHRITINQPEKTGTRKKQYYRSG
jgi:hypothetical protein